LIVFGTVLALITLVTAAAPFEGFQGGVGDRTVTIQSIDDIQADYNWAMGVLVIDLRNIDDLQGAVPVNASVGMGELVVRVPEDSEFAVEAMVGAGEIEILERVVDGVGLDETYKTPGYETSSDSFVLDLQTFTGRVEVTDG
jgi:predicted membrane protein